MAPSCYLTCTEGTACKFWQCDVSGSDTTVTFGKLGTPGSKSEKSHKDNAAAVKFFEKMKAEKVAKGYTEVKGKAKAGASAKAKAEVAPKAKAKAKAKEEPSGGTKRKAPNNETAGGSSSSSGPPAKLLKGGSTELLENAKAAAASGAGSKGGTFNVDSNCPGAEKKSVFEDYSVKLNQTHCDANNNKFYIIQVVKEGSKYFAWNRWGRVGEVGTSSLSGAMTEVAAINEFKKKFRDKSGNAWDNRANFEAKKGKYIIVETEEGSGGQDSAPMGKLTEAQIGKGQTVLETIEEELKKKRPVTEKLESLSSEFYSLIPHNFGRNRPPAIKTDEMLQAKVELLKFYLRMGFEQIEEDQTLGPIDKVLDLPLPQSLDEAAEGICAKGPVNQCNKKGAEMASKQACNPRKKMDASLYGAIMLYTSNAIYRELNQALRDENRQKIKKYFKYLRLFFESMDYLPKEKRTLWRGLSVDLHDNPQYQVGKTVTWWGVSSCTSEQKVAQSFAKGCGGSCTIITVESETASDISAISVYSNEKESLLCPGTQLKVKSKKRNGKITEITLQEVGRAIK
eukprot:TRINITY_DN1119_c0_g2_i1.p1 TRINITY_DN1119_c0_g2~~TRINITY_DN1119_c0_g2_i1.p1  ORF type:complete len:567 (-),score=178.91 TRINITY_DN1119_c0_g2_i1:332-2032(-)